MDALRAKKTMTLLAFVLLLAGVCFAEEKKQAKDIWAEEFDINSSEERVTALLKGVGKKDAEFAAKLRELRYDHPDQFWKELRDKGYLGKPKPQKPKNPAVVNREKKLNEEYCAWLEKNFVEEWAKLKRIKESNPAIFDRHTTMSRRLYCKIMETQKRNPALAGVMKEDVLLSKKRNELVSKIQYAKDDKEKQKLITELTKVVAARFEVIVKKKQIQYETLEKNLERLKKRIAWQKAETKKLIDKKDQATKERVAELLSDTEKVNWK